MKNHFIQPPKHFPGDAPPANYGRCTIQLAKPVAHATLRYAAFGIAEPWLNGQRLNDDRFLPGWSDFRKRLYVVEENVGDRIKEGTNVLGFILGNGWAGLTYGPWAHAKCHVDFLAISVELRVTYIDDIEESFHSSADWRWTSGPVLSQSLYHGETYDAREELADWMSEDVDKRRWKKGRSLEPHPVELTPRKCAPVRVIQELAPQKIWKAPNGRWLIDFGQNLVGVSRLQVKEKRGTKLSLRFAEMLREDGNIYTENLRGARATDVYISKGSGVETFAPRWTFHGFRYAEIDGLSRAPETTEISAQVLHNDLKATGSFKASDPLLNRLQQCILWGQKGNFLEVPTDCPQRDERLGWSCDAQVFVKTACFNYDCEDFYRQWMDSMRDGQRVDGAFPDLAPDVLGWHGNAGWGDGGVIVPYVVWKFYGSSRIVEENWLAMERYMDFLSKRGRELIQPDTVYGDWLATDALRPDWGPTPKDMIGTAYFAFDAGLMAEMALALGRKAEAKHYKDLRTKVVKQFQKHFTTPSGLVLGDTQTSYLLALGFDLMPEALIPAATERLLEKLKARDWHLSTGFLGTPLLNPVLSKVGRTDVAYTLLEQKTYPGWLYPILNGATTMWERWNSWSHESGFGDAAMNSFNHYAFGAIGEWLYATVAGLEIEGSSHQPAVRIAPRPGNRLKSAAATYVTKRGKVSCKWNLTGKGFKLSLLIPDGITTDLSIPAKSWKGVTINKKIASQFSNLEPYSHGLFASAKLQPGKYEIIVPQEQVMIAQMEKS